MQRNIPVRQILPDLAVLGIAQRQPSTDKELSQARGVDERFSRGKLASEILAAVAEGKLAEPPDARPGGDDLDRDLRPAVTLVSAWVSQVARTERIDAAILATRADLVAFLARDPDARLCHGWRGELLGEGITRLIEGKAGLTFDRGDGLKLVDI
jgi:ribonuclease D